jgi:hypothetical protein
LDSKLGFVSLEESQGIADGLLVFNSNVVDEIGRSQSKLESPSRHAIAEN